MFNCYYEKAVAQQRVLQGKEAVMVDLHLDRPADTCSSSAEKYSEHDKGRPKGLLLLFDGLLAGFTDFVSLISNRKRYSRVPKIFLVLLFIGHPFIFPQYAFSLGEFVGKFGGYGSDDGQFYLPTGIAVDNNYKWGIHLTQVATTCCVFHVAPLVHA